MTKIYKNNIMIVCSILLKHFLNSSKYDINSTKSCNSSTKSPQTVSTRLSNNIITNFEILLKGSHLFYVFLSYFFFTNLHFFTIIKLLTNKNDNK